MLIKLVGASIIGIEIDLLSRLSMFQFCKELTADTLDATIWVGGKEKLAPYIRQVFPPNVRVYLEPCGGSGAHRREVGWKRVLCKPVGPGICHFPPGIQSAGDGWRKTASASLTQTSTDSRSSISKSVESHLMACAIEEARLTGKVVDLQEFKKSLR